MQETVQEYTTRLIGYIAKEEPFKTLRSTPDRLRRILQKASRKTLTKRPAPGRWSVAEIVAHLAEGELVLAYRMRMILSSNGTAIQAYDQEIWNSNAGYLHKDLQKSYEFFRHLRQQNIAFLRSIPRVKWENYGMHSERGKESINRMVQLTAGHDINHLMQLKLLVGKSREAS